METAREERPYDAGLGAGGKFRKRPFRRSQAATPYDRPPAAPRNPTADSGGWLSKVVDPAHRLITAGAYRLFSSVFRKRLTPPEAIQEPRDEQQEAVSSDSSGAHKIHINGNNYPRSGSDRGGLSELEQILKQKTFSRSEVDRLTTLLCSRSDEMPVDDEEKISEMIPSKALAFHDRKECLQTPLGENVIENHLMPTPVISVTVLDEDVASPSELAKAYMGSRPSKVSPLRLGLYSEAPRGDSTVISNSPFPPKSPIVSLVPRASGLTPIPANNIVTPKSRGRSAIYNMARAPYSRVHQTATIKGSGPRSDAYGGTSASTSSQYEWELNSPFGSQQGALKRRSSVLDNDMRSVGPIRRIRQKPNLVSQKGLSSPVSAPHPSSSIKILTDNGDSNMLGTSCTRVPSKSKEMASKIFQHLEKLTTPNEKSPTKLSPSMLHGMALRSLENPYSPEVFEYTHDNKSFGPVNSSLHDAQKSTSEKEVLVEANGPTEFLSLCNASAESGANTMVSIKDTMSSVDIGNTSLTNTVAHPPLKKWAFQMSAHEDFLDLDDDIFSNVVASTPSAEAGEKLDSSVSVSKIIAPEALVEKPSLPSTNFVLNQENNLGASDGSVLDERCTGFGLAMASSSTTVRPVVEASQTSFVSDNGDLSNAAPHPIFSFGNKVTPPKEPIAASPSFGLASKSDGMVPQPIFSSSAALSGSSVLKFGSSSDPKSESLSSFATNSAGTTDSVIKVPESAEIHIENSKQSGLQSEVISKTPETPQFSAISKSTPKEGIFALGASSGSSLNNGFLSSSPNPLLFSVPPLFSGNTTSQSSCNGAALSASSTISTTITTSCSLPIFAPVSSPSAAPIFKFGSSAVPSSSALHASGASGLQTGEAKVQQDTSFGNSSSTALGGTSLVAASAGSSIFGFSAAATSTANSLSQGSTPFSASSGSLPAGSDVTTITQSKPIQFGTSESTSLSGSSSSSSFSSSSSHIVFSAPAATLFSSASGFGVSSSGSSSNGNTVSSSSGTASGLFGSSLQHTKSPIFGSSFNSTSSSTGFSFGAPAASVTTSSTSMSFGSATTSVAPTSSAPMPFGSTLTSSAATSAPMLFGSSASSGAVTNFSTVPFGSTSAASSGSLFSFTAPGSGSSNGVSGFSFTSGSPTTSSQPVFGNPNPVFGTGPVSASNGQINMEDSMAEDTVQASTGTIPTFSQQPFSPAPSSFVFGGSTAPSGANPFQFGGQQNLATQQTSSPFQASGSLDLNASGNFSLGTGGGDKSNRRIVKVKGKHRRK